MSLQGVDLQAMDVFEFLYNDAGTGKTLFSGFTNSSSITNKNDKVDIFAGIGQGKKASLKTKKETTVKGKIAKFDLAFMAAQNGVDIDTTSTGSFYFDKSFTVTTLSATVTNATRIFSVKKLNGACLKIVTGTPAAIDEVKVAGTTLTFYTGFADASVLVTYAAPATEGKDNLTVTFNSQSFPKNGELLCRTVVYSGKTDIIAADAYVNFYEVSMNGDYTWTFDMGKPLELDIEFEIIIPTLLPDGTLNSAGDTGKLVVTER